MSGVWSFAVPVDDAGNASPVQVQHAEPVTPEQEPAKHVPRRTPSNWDLQSDSEATKTRRASVRSSHAANMRKRSRNTLRDNKRDVSQKRDEPSVDDSAWIHRDKLAQIEIQEMKDAGIPVRRVRRSTTTSHEDAPPNDRQPDARRDSQTEADYDGEYTHANGINEVGKKRVSTIPAADEEEQEQAREQGELQTDGAEDASGERPAFRQHAIRPSTSRIPISTSGPVPVPQTVVDRDSPLPRSRGGSGGIGSGNWDELQYARKARSNSIGSQVMLDEGDKNSENSPPKNRTAKANGVRKASGQGSKSRNPSTSMAKRPGSRSGPKLSASPPSAYPPIDPESSWATSMYAPDPRLPPDQQVIPTHARRMAQAKLGNSTAPAPTLDAPWSPTGEPEYDYAPEPSPRLPRNPSPLPASSPPPEETKFTAGDRSSKRLSRYDAEAARPGTSGGYKITPTIPSAPTMARFSMQQPPPPHHEQVQRVPDLDEKDDGDSGKGCCCVMM